MKTLVKFLGVGVIATLIQYLILVVLVEKTTALPYIASAIGYLISAIFNYLVNYYFSFGSSADHITAISKFFVVVAIGLSINSALMFFATEVAKFGYVVSQLGTTAFVTFSNFIFLKNWAYK